MRIFFVIMTISLQYQCAVWTALQRIGGIFRKLCNAQLHSVHCTISSVIRGIFRLLHISGHQAGGSLTNADLFSELMTMWQSILLIKLHAILIPTMSVKELNSVITTLWTMNCHYSDDDDDDDDNDDDDGDEIKVLCQVEVTSVSLFFINSCTLARLPRAGLSVRWWWWRWRRE